MLSSASSLPGRRHREDPFDNRALTRLFCTVVALSARSSDRAQNGPICSLSPACGGQTDKSLFSPKFPPSRLADAFDQVVEPLITGIT